MAKKKGDSGADILRAIQEKGGKGAGKAQEQASEALAAAQPAPQPAAPKAAPAPKAAAAAPPPSAPPQKEPPIPPGDALYNKLAKSTGKENPTSGDVVKQGLKEAAMAVGKQAFDTAFPSLSKAMDDKIGDLKKDIDDSSQESARSSASNSRSMGVVADRIGTTNQLLQISIARQEMTNTLLKDLIKEIKEKSLGGGSGESEGIGLDSVGDMLGRGRGAQPRDAKGRFTKVQPKSSMLGKAGNLVRGAGAAGLLARGGVAAIGDMALGAFGVGENKIDEKQDDENWNKASLWEKIQSAPARGIEKVGSFIVPNIANEAKASRIASETEYLRKKEGGTGASADVIKAQQEAKANLTTNARPAATTMAAPVASTGLTPGLGATNAVTNNTTNNTVNNNTTEGGAVGGDQVDQILATIRKRESGGNYQAKAKGSSASGAYQFIDSTWQSLSQKFGAGNYKSAGEAPPDVQDKVARAYVQEILQKNNGDVSKVPLVWYTGNAQGQMSARALAANGGLTAQAYQAKWMGDFGKQSQAQTQTASATGGMDTGSKPSAAGAGTSSFYAGSQGASASTPYGGALGGAGRQGSESSGNTGWRSQNYASLGANIGRGPDASALKTGQNGMLDRSQLVPIGGGHVMKPEAAKAYQAMVKAAGAEGITWGITDSYRDYNSQVKVAREKGLYSQGGLAARPGTSNHGWGLATDLKLSDAAFQWLQQNGRKFGFKNIPREKWHWEYAGGEDSSVMADAGNKDATKVAGEGAPAGGAAGGTPPAGGAGTNMASLSSKESTALKSASAVGATPSKGAELNQASTQDIGEQRSAKSSVTVNQQTASVAGTDTTSGDTGSKSVGNVEPVDARTRLAELFGISSVA